MYRLCNYQKFTLPFVLERVEKMETNTNEIIINNVSYVPKNSEIGANEGLQYVIVRTLSAGVFAGSFKSRVGQEVVLLGARRIWYWEGAASLSQLAMEGTSRPEKCKFPIAVDRIELLQVIEILDCTNKAKKSIQGVPIWKQ